MAEVSRAVLEKRARRLRAVPTGAEHHLRYWLQQAGAKGIKRQVIIGRCIVDLAIPNRNLLIEVDGVVHASRRRKDAARDAWLRGCGFNIVRVANRDVLHGKLATALAILGLAKETKENEKAFKRSMTVARKASAK